MKSGQMTIHLEPVQGGAYTRLWIQGTLPTAVPRPVAAKLARELAFWSGWPVSCVLSAGTEAETDRWCAWWTDLLAGICAQHLELRYRHRRPERSRARRGER